MSGRSTLRMALITSSFLIIAIGVFFALSGAAWGVWVAGAGLVDLLTLPFVIRMIERDQAPESPPAGGADPAATDPSYNPYGGLRAGQLRQPAAPKRAVRPAPR